MPATLTALFATALHEIRAAHADASGLQESLDLLAHATRATPVRFEITTIGCTVNTMPIPLSAPGADLLHRALIEHHTKLLGLPAGLPAQRWGDVAAMYASTPGLYPSVEEVRRALKASVPDIVVEGNGAGIQPPTPERKQLDEGLEPLLASAQAAHDAANIDVLAHVLLELEQLEANSPAGLRGLVARERRRICDATVLDTMVHRLPQSDAPPAIARAVINSGRDGAEALLRALALAQTPHARHAYLEALTMARDGEEVVLAALTSPRIGLARDAAEIAGRRGIGRAVPPLAQLLRHREESVRTTAWHALERIGTREALRALQELGA